MRTFSAVLAVVAVVLAALPLAMGAHATPSPASARTIAATHGVAPIKGPISTPAGAPSSGLAARFPHPGPIPASHPLSYAGHYYAGSVYNGTPVNTTQLSATWNVPEDNPQLTDFYYVLLSVWDDAGSYDQVGFANAGGVWGFTYSSTDYCASYYFYNPDAFNLNEGTTYTFAMTLYKGVVNFTADYLDGTNAFTWTQYTGGHHFLDEGFYTCDGGYGNFSYYDLTDYEEVYQTNNTMVPYDWHFQANLGDALALAPWSVFTTPPLPGTIDVGISGANTLIANEPYELAFDQGPPWFTLVSGNHSVSLHTAVAVSALVGSPATTLGGYVVPGGWSVAYSPSSGTGSYSSNLTLTVPSNTGAGNYTIGLDAADASGASNQITVWVNLISSVSMSVQASPHRFADVGQNITFWVTSGGGVSGVALSWNGLPVDCFPGAATRFVCPMLVAGTYPISVTAQDSYGDSATSAALVFLVYNDPAIVLTPIPSYSDVGQPIGWYTSVSGGAGTPYSYRFASLPSGCTVKGPNATCTVSTPGTYNVTVTVTDASGYGTVSAVAPIQVVPGPAISVAASSQTADAHQTIWINATGVGGSGSFSYSWPGLPSGCSATGTHAVCSFATPGGYYVSAMAQDAAGAFSAVQRVYLTISPEVTVRLGAPLASVDLGQSTTISTTVAGGLPGYHYNYSGLPVGCTSADTGALACTPTTIGSYPGLTVFVTDANRFVVNATLNFTVYPAPSLALTLAPTSVALGSSVTLTAVVTGGSGGETFVWSDLPGGCLGTTAATVSCVPSGTGSYAVSVVMTDTNGGHANASAILTVTPAPLLGTTSLVALVGLGIGIAAVAAALVVWRLRRRPGTPDAERAQ